MKSPVVWAAAFAVTLMAADTHACGDSLYRVGKGISFRVYTAPLPGSVLVYGASPGAAQLAQELAKSGHGVRVVTNSEELRSELGSGSYDVVIAAYSDHAAVESDTSAGLHTQYLPVALTEEEEFEARQRYDRVMMAEHDEIKHYLKAIHLALKQ